MPYLGLVVLSLILTVFSWRKTGSLRFLPFHLCLSGLVFVFDFVVFVLLDSYRYTPRLVKDPWFDGVLGGIASDGFIVPAAGVFLTVYRLGWPGMTAAALAFMGMEILFLSLGVYADNWWNVLYTGLSLPVFFLIARWIWRLIRCRMDRPLPRFLILYFVNLTLQFSLVFLYSALLGALQYRLPWFADVSRGHVVFINLCVLADSLLFAAAAAAGVRRMGLFVITGILLAVNLLQFKYGLIRTPLVTNLLGLTLVQAASLFLLTAFRRLLTPRSS